MLMLLFLVPVLFALIIFFVKTHKILAAFVRLGAASVVALSIIFCVQNFNEILIVDLSMYPWIKYAALLLEALMAGYLIYKGIKNKSTLLVILSGAQVTLMAAFELLHKGEEIKETLYIDKLSLLMILIIGVIGGLICLYAVEYMKDFHHHHPEVEDRKGLFFAVLFVFLAAMFGIVTSNDMTLMLFFWEITSFSSFLLIGYTKTKEAVRNSMLAINMNVFGGLLFTVGIILLGVFSKTGDFNSLMAIGDTPMTVLAVFFLACAAFTKSAQMPFSKWLLGAMVAPTPTSAMLHSSTMVKAGVYLLLRICPLLGSNAAGVTVTTVGGITFFAAALMAVSQVDAKRVLAYSTISNLGLIVACAGIDTAESLWAAVMLIVFHAIAKSLLFLSVGSTEHQLGSRSVEAMDGLIRISKQLTMFLIIGIAGMFVAPFGMLISKWAAMKAFLDSNNILIVILVAFGSTVTLFFWTKWMGKLIANADRTAPTTYIMRPDEKVSLYSLAAMVIIVCLAHPLISYWFVVPYINSNIYVDFVSPIDATASTIIILMLCMVFVLPLVLRPIYKKYSVKTSLVYLSGENTGDDENFYASSGEIHHLELRNWYMEDIFGEHVLLQKSIYLGIGILLAGFCAVLGGILV